MGSADVVKTVHLGKGNDLLITINKSEPEGSPEKYVVIVKHDGKDDSELLFIPPHWHKHHDEYISVVEGRLQLSVGGKVTVAEAGDPPVFIPRWSTHSMQGFKGEKTTFEERQNPPGIYKGLFFNDLLSSGRVPTFWHLMRVFADWDTYPGLPGNVKIIEQLIVCIFGLISRLFIPPKPEHF